MSTMLTLVLRYALLVATTSGGAAAVTATATAGQDQLDQLRERLERVPATPAPTLPPPVTPPAISPVAPDPTNPLDAAIVEWKQLQSGSYTFDSYARFLLAHPGWPGETALRRAAERSLDASAWSPGAAVSYFRRFPPLTTAGKVRQAEALAAVGLPDQANAAAREAWRQGTLAPGDEAIIASRFAAALGPADHDARMDQLLWQGATTAAQRQLAWIGPARRELFAARLALRTNSADAATLSASTDDRFGNDAGYVADRALWLANAGAQQQARAWLARPRTVSTPPGSPGRWFDLLLAQARAALAGGETSTAYAIAQRADDAYPAGTDVSERPYGERDDYTSLAWLAGRAALTQLGRPAEAATWFDRYARASQSPTTRAKGLYWAGRAADTAGLRDRASGYFAAAAQLPDQFYGQLAAERLGRPLAPPSTAAATPVDPVARAAFNRSEIVRAARYLGAIGARQDQTTFIRQIALDAKSDSDHVLAAELSRALDRPDLGVMIGRSALKNGLTSYGASGFPSVPVPEGKADAWTMIHAIARQESQFDRAAVSRAGARGLMQLMPGTAREVAGKLGLAYDSAALTADPNYNIELGSSYFQKLHTYYGSYPLAIAAYNAGMGRVNQWIAANGDPRAGGIDMVDWIEAIPVYETRNYVQRVLENAVVYDLLNPRYARSSGSARLSWYLGRKPG